LIECRSSQHPLLGYVLAGGRSSRMGRDKALLEIDGLPLVAHAVGKLNTFCESVAICGNDPALAAWGRLIPDSVSGAGPMAALVAATADAASTGREALTVFLPVDVPLLPAAVLARLASRAQSSGKWATLLEADGHVQPLCAVYRAEMAAPLQSQLANGELIVMRAVETICGTSQLDRVPVAELYDGTEPPGCEDWFLNVNAPADLEKATQLWQPRRVS
jgi:molybdenum cofactor guanylyltransferase